MRDSPTTRSASTGFTLIELMVVILLLGILTASIIPSMQGTLEAERLHAQCRRLVGAIELAYSRAVTLSQPHRLRLDTNEHRFFLETRRRGPDGRAGFAAIPYTPGAEGDLDPRIAVRLLPSGTSLEPERDGASSASDEPRSSPPVDQPPTFYPDGTADAVTLVLQDRQGFRQALEVNPITARVRVRALPRQ